MFTLRNNDGSNVTFVSPAELSKLLGISIPTIHKMRREGVLPKPMELGHRFYRWRGDDIEAWIENRGLTKEQLDVLAKSSPL